MKRSPLATRTSTLPRSSGPLRRVSLNRSGRIRPQPKRAPNGADSGSEAFDDEPDGTWVFGDPEWPEARRSVLRRDRNTCQMCGQPGGDVHHRIALQAGGRRNDPNRHSRERLVTLCRQHHSWVHQHPHDARLTGYIVPTWTPDAAVIPLITFTGTVLLGQDGRVSTQAVKYR